MTELFERLRAMIGGPATAQHGPPRPGEPRRSVLDIAHAKRVLEWAPRVGLDEGLRRTVEYFAGEMARASGDWNRASVEV